MAAIVSETVITLASCRATTSVAKLREQHRFGAAHERQTAAGLQDVVAFESVYDALAFWSAAVLRPAFIQISASRITFFSAATISCSPPLCRPKCEPIRASYALSGRTMMPCLSSFSKTACPSPTRTIITKFAVPAQRNFHFGKLSVQISAAFIDHPLGIAQMLVIFQRCQRADLSDAVHVKWLPCFVEHLDQISRPQRHSRYRKPASP